jgi:hypothetical protein
VSVAVAVGDGVGVGTEVGGEIGVGAEVGAGTVARMAITATRRPTISRVIPVVSFERGDMFSL